MPHIHVIGGVSDRDAPAPVVSEPIQVEDILAVATVLAPESTAKAAAKKTTAKAAAKKTTAKGR